MAKRRGHGEGSVYKRKDGRWVAVLELGWQGAVRRRQAYYGRTKREALDQLAEGRAKLLSGLPLGSSRQTVADFLDAWLRDIVKPNARPSTYVAYEAKVRLYLEPALGRLHLARLSQQHVQAYVAAAQGAGVPPGVIRYSLTVLSVALAHAERQNLIARNVARLVIAPRPRSREIEPLDVEGARRFLGAIRGHRYEAILRVALSLGIRRGEVLGLRWQDTDLDERAVRIRVQLQKNPLTQQLELVELKSPKSRRAINLPDFAVRALREQRTRQLEERLRAGEAWGDWQGAGLVFTTELGEPVHPRRVRYEFEKLRAAAALPSLRFHDARHTCATFLLAQGVDARVVMEILGHSNLAMTQRYTHILPPLRQDAADRLDAAFSQLEGEPE